jgi:flagellar basal-body rod modification protein FlgD
MTTVTSQNQVSQSLLDTVNGKKSTSTDTVDEAQDRFMTLLVTQMKNQDPLNPMDNAQVTSQMAQLSTVSGINKLNDTVAGLISNMNIGQTYQAANMIGHSVLVQGNQIAHEKTGGYFGVDVPAGADSLTVNIKNSAGLTVRTLNFGSQEAGSNSLNWDGYTDSGSLAPSGNYSFEVSGKIANSAASVNPLSFAKVVSVSTQNGSVKLNLSNNTAVGTTDVKEIY